MKLHSRCVQGWCLFGIILLIMLSLAGGAFADPPATINIRGQLLDAQGHALPGLRDFSVQFFDAGTGGAALGSVILGQTEVSIEGLFNIPVTLPPQVILSPQAWYEVAVASGPEPAPLTGADLFPNRIKMESVPFSLEAAEAAHVDVSAIGSGTILDAEFGYLSGVTGSIQTQINAKANAADVYTKGEVDTSQAAQDLEIAVKANAADVYTKGEVDTSQAAQDLAIAAKANAADVAASQSAQDSAIAGKVAKAGDTMAGPLGMTPAAAPSPATDKLYNVGGTLQWNGNPAYRFPWTTVTANTQMAANNGYITNSASLLTLTLPLSTAVNVGDTLRITGLGAGGWKIAQNASQSILLGPMQYPNESGTWMASETNRGWVGVASSSDGLKLVAIDMGGYIYTSTDSGVTWVQRTVAGSRNWRAVASSADGTKLVAVVWNGYIYTSIDSGATWIQRAAGYQNWTCVASSADGITLVACAGTGGIPRQIYTSTDSGATWTARDSARNWYAVASSSDGAKLVATVDGAGIYTSTDSGANWTPQASAPTARWFGVASSSDGTKLAAAIMGGQIYTSTNSGVTWTLQTGSPSGNWRSLASSSDGAKLVGCVDGGQIYTSTDSGTTWTPCESNRTWYSVASSADGTKLVAGASGAQIYTLGGTMTRTVTGTSGSISGPTETAVELQYAGNNVFRVLSYEAPTTPQLDDMLANVYTKAEVDGSQAAQDAVIAAKADTSDLFVWNVVTTNTQMVGNNGYLANAATVLDLTLPPSASLNIGDTVRVTGLGAGGWKIAQNTSQVILTGPTQTPDYSGAWTPRETSRNWSDVTSSSDGTKLVACVNGGQIYTSANSGVSWTPRDSVRQWFSLASSSDGTKLVACVINGQIYTSTNSGVTWTARDSTRQWYEVASSSDGTKLVACVQNGQIYTSTDSGVTWTPRDSNRNWYDVASSSDGTKLVACVMSSGQIYTSTDSGVTWTPRDSARNWFGVASSADGTRLVASAWGGQLYTSTNSGVTWTPRDSNRNWLNLASSSDGTKLVACVQNGQIYTSTDSGMTWTACDSVRQWYDVASSADGTKLLACVTNGQLYTYSTVKASTTAGTAGYLAGAMNTAVELQYIGNDTFVPLSHEGTLTVN